MDTRLNRPYLNERMQKSLVNVMIEMEEKLEEVSSGLRETEQQMDDLERRVDQLEQQCNCKNDITLNEKFEMEVIKILTRVGLCALVHD